MTDTRAALAQALEALRDATTYTGSEAWSPSMTRECEAAITAAEAALAAPQEPPDEFEVRADGNRVRVDRWEVGIRRIVALLWGNRHEFEVDDVVDAVRALVPSPNEDEHALVMAVLALRDGGKA